MGLSLIRLASSLVESFRGIPFALPPVGDLRFAPPVADNRTLGTFNATNWGPSCIQMEGVGDPVAAAITGTFRADSIGALDSTTAQSAPNNQVSIPALLSSLCYN